MHNAITWFEIPATDFSRAVGFYSTILAQAIREDDFMGIPHGFFAADQRGVGGAIVAPHDATPASGGTLIYINAGQELEQIVARIAPAGGTVVLDKTPIGPQGWMAIFIDTEGNRIGLHQPAAN